MNQLSFNDLPEAVYQLSKKIDLLLNEKPTKREEKEEILTVQETADFFKTSKPTIYRWLKEGAITMYGISGSRFFKKSELIESLTKLKK